MEYISLHQTILSMIEEVSKYKRVVLLFNYQQQYSEIYQTWLDVYSCFDLNIKSQFNNEFKPTTLLQTSYEGNILADQIGKLLLMVHLPKKVRILIMLV